MNSPRVSEKESSDKPTSSTRCHYNARKKASRNHRDRTRGILEPFHSSLDLHREGLSPGYPDSGRAEARGEFAVEARRVETGRKVRFSGCLDMTAPPTGGFRI